MELTARKVLALQGQLQPPCDGDLQKLRKYLGSAAENLPDHQLAAKVLVLLLDQGS